MGGVSLCEINQLESYYLEVIDYQLFISEQEFTQFHDGLIIHIAEVVKIQQAAEAML